MTKVIGIDLGEKKHIVVFFDEHGKESKPFSIPNTREGLSKILTRHPGCTVVIEAGTHSPSR